MDGSVTTDDPQSAIDCLERGRSALHAQNWAAAESEFDEALRRLPHNDRPRRAEAYAGLAEVHVGRNHYDEALFCLEEAVHAHPTREETIRRALDLSVVTEHHGVSLEMRRRLLALPISEEERIAQRRATVHDALFVAIDALAGLRGLSLPGFDVLDRLRAVYEAAGDVGKATDVLVARAESVPTPHERAIAMTRAADFCAERTQCTDRAVALYEAAIADAPAVRGAFEAIERVLVHERDFQGLEKAYVRQAERLDQADARPELVSLLGRLAALRRDLLQNPKGAIEALSHKIQLDPSNVEARASLAAILESEGTLDRACRVLETSCWHAPTRADTYHALFRLYTQAKMHDRAFQCSAGLVHLGEADLNEQLLYQQYRPESGLAPKAALDEADWAELYPLEHDANVRKLLDIIGPVATVYRIAALEKSGKLRTATAKTRQDPDTSTVSAVRSLQWGAKVIRVPLPEIHVLPDHAVGLSTIPTRDPVIVVGKPILSGRSVAELAFLVGRDLTYFLPEHRVFTYFPSVAEMTMLVTVAIRLAIPGKSSKASLPDHSLALALESGLEPADWNRVRSIVEQIESTGSKIDMHSYVKSLEIAATRVGLLLSGDLPTAGKLLSTDIREVAGLRAADRMRDLLPYAVSASYATLRAKLGLEAG